jgi:SNF2 family DNA or RNA helicase
VTVLERCSRTVGPITSCLFRSTPIQNDLGEFYAMLDFAVPDVLGPLARFNKIFAKPIAVRRRYHHTQLMYTREKEMF